MCSATAGKSTLVVIVRSDKPCLEPSFEHPPLFQSSQFPENLSIVPDPAKYAGENYWSVTKGERLIRSSLAVFYEVHLLTEVELSGLLGS